jgi:hypothetical protein
LHSFGLLSGSFRPDNQVCVLRSYICQRDTFIKEAATHVQRMQKALIQMNLHLHQVISDITGLTGMTIIRALVAGERNPYALAALKDRRIHSSTEDIAKALTGDDCAEYPFVLQEELVFYDVYQQQIAKCDRQIEQCLASFEPQTQDPPPTRRGKRRKTENSKSLTFTQLSLMYSH